jgi:uncharacterized protein (TIRG00374 family)
MLRRALAGIGLGVALYAAAVLLADADRLRAALREFAGAKLLLALAFATGNYALRFAKWELCLGWLGVRAAGAGNAPGLTHTRSALIYVAGLSMSVTPGKLGEVLRSVLLKASDGVSGSRTAPIVVADRLTDLIALVLLSLLGIAGHAELWPVVLGTLAIVLGAVAALGSPAFLSRALALVSRLGLRAIASRAEALVASSAELLRLRSLATLTALSVLGWGLECVGYFCVLRGFAGTDPALAQSAFLWASTTLIGAVSFLPGGLGATEGSLAVLAARLVPGVDSAIALASTFLIRVATLWYAVALGGAALAIFVRSPALAGRKIEAE